jgi:hypothetical protein
MFKKYKKFVILGLFLALITGGLFFLKNIGLAQTTSPPDLGLQQVGDNIGLPTTDIRLIIARIIRIALGLLGIVALVLILYAGFTWMTAGGDEEKISQAKKILINAVIGLAIILSSYAIASFVISKLTAASSNGVSNDVAISNFESPYFPTGAFYVENLPQEGQLCTRNIHLAITFNREVDLETLIGNVVVQDKDSSQFPGTWQSLGNSTAVFVPKGDCGSGDPDCFAPSTTYSLHFKNPTRIKNSDGQMTLNCSIKAGCRDVKFTTGDGVDRNPPQIKIEKISQDLLFAGAVIPLKVSYVDDNGVQKVDLSADNYFVGSQAIVGCQKSGTVTINWPTANIASGEHVLTATGYDWAALSDSTSTVVNLLPQHCVDNTLQADLGEEKVGPLACGGECGACAGAPCVKNTDCGSGFCETGFCKDKMRINGVSPLSGGPGTIFSISGNYFGNSPGKVFINNTEAKLDACGAVSWKPWQILAEVPVGAVSGPIRVETASDAKSGVFVDATNDDFGPAISDFEVNNLVRPGLCSISPASGLPGKEVSLLGKRLGNAPGKIIFGQQNAIVNLANWSDSLVKTVVPQLESGLLGVTVSQNNLESNNLRFFVEESVNDNSPIISSITPDSGAKGEYITITGKNFGNQLGRVWFKENNNGQPGDAIEGDFRFPSDCKNTWTDTQIIVKFPAGSGDPGKSYFVQVRSADPAQNPSIIGPVFNLENGQPSPGICSLDPLSGPVPFLENNSLHIVGEYLGQDPVVYFWSPTASATTTDGRLEGASSTAADLLIGQSLTTLPPLGASTGPVTVYRKSDKKISNPVDFSVLDCIKNHNTCTAPNTHCCVSGGEAGLCRLNNQLCEGETLSAGYIWRFSTKDIPKIPHVVERCDDGTDLGKNIPSPSPSAQWDVAASDPHHNVCRSASVVVEFSLPNINNIAKTDLIVNECQNGTIDEARNTCTVLGQPVPVSQAVEAVDFVPKPGAAGAENTDYLELNPSINYHNGKWKDSTWYQVVLKSTISAGAGASLAPLSKDKPCSPDSAYCFVFKTGSQDCRVKKVVITPYTYWTSVLEEPIKDRENVSDDGVDVEYSGHGLSSQHCIMMNMRDFAWSWSSTDIYYSDIFPENVRNNNIAKVSALANTVGVGLKTPEPDNVVNAINIKAKAELEEASYEGVSPLTIDLNNPEVVDFWPKCTDSCTNAEVGVRFNTTMSNKNLPGSNESGPVKLLKCNDENCFDTTPILSSDDVVLDGVGGYKVLKIANSSANSIELEPNSIYQVILSASTTAIDSPDLLWSAARLGAPLTFSKPYNKEFTWKFKTKKDKCKISRVDVAPKSFVADLVGDKKIYSAQPYSSPDSCAAQGQKLNPWSVDWDWTSSDAAHIPNVVAKVQSYSSKGSSAYCTKDCILKGSSLPFGVLRTPVCGNLIVEAGEDCDPPLKGAGCSLNCKRLGNPNSVTCGNGAIDSNLGETCDPADHDSAVGCSNVCLRTGSNPANPADQVGASVCGNGLMGSGEDCDLGIAPSLLLPNSSLGCSGRCLHQGTKLASNWCFDNLVLKGGFSAEDYNRACKNSISRCGNGIEDPDEDAGCDLGEGNISNKCNIFCLRSSNDHVECAVGREGCSRIGQNIGSSLLYSAASLCGDGVVGMGEDAFCEHNLVNNHVGNNPWALATGIGLVAPVGIPPMQKSDIIATTNDNTIGGPISNKGQFSIACGYTSDQQCKDKMGDSWGLATDSCCHERPKLISVFPGTTTEDIFNVCPNTAIEAIFNENIDPGTLKNNVVLARGTTNATCGENEDVTSLAMSVLPDSHLPWYRRAIAYVSNLFKNLIGQKVEADIRDHIEATKWCSGADLGQIEAEKIEDGKGKISFRLSKPLAVDTDYMAILKKGIRSDKGISIGENNVTNKPLGWKFITGSRVCEIDKVSANPSQIYFAKADVTSTVRASAYSENSSRLQPIPGFYSWEYVWQPINTSYFSATSTTSSINIITSKNHNGEDDVRVSAVIIDNMYSAQRGTVASAKTHVIVFLCENPWPPKDLIINGDGPYTIFPYEDKVGNNDGYNLNANTFDNSAIPASVAGGYFNFRTYYCADNGGFGKNDDLPYLAPAVQVSSTIVSDSPTSSLKRFIFTNSVNTDGIGIQVFSNPKHLTVSDWFTNDRALGGHGFAGEMTAVKIDGYDAITDGNNIYVDALNYSDTSNKLFSNVYLFSINADAKTETRRVFEQVLGNLKFNTNLTNYGYCGADIGHPGVSTTCRTDFDCSGGEVCSVQTDKLKRNYRRLRDLQTIQDLFGI